MKKKVIVIITTAILTVGAVTTVYANGNSNINSVSSGGNMMKDKSYEGMTKMHDSVSRQKMIDIHNSMMGR